MGIHKGVRKWRARIISKNAGVSIKGRKRVVTRRSTRTRRTTGTQSEIRITTAIPISIKDIGELIRLAKAEWRLNRRRKNPFTYYNFGLALEIEGGLYQVKLVDEPEGKPRPAWVSTPIRKFGTPEQNEAQLEKDLFKLNDKIDLLLKGREGKLRKAFIRVFNLI